MFAITHFKSDATWDFIMTLEDWDLGNLCPCFSEKHNFLFT